MENEPHFEDTKDPHSVTVEDVASWAEALGQFIRDNPDQPAHWLARCLLLYRKIDAVNRIMAQSVDQQSTLLRADVAAMDPGPTVEIGKKR